jgi:hypothetical protein
MATCDTSACRTDNSPERSVRVLRWTFRRQKDAIVCELGLNIDDCAYELRVDPAWNPAGVTTELFDDAMSAFERHATIERMLVEAGWMLEGFESGYRSARPFQ